MKLCATLIYCVLMICSVAFAQAAKPSSGGVISGKVIDAQTGKPVEYATVVVFSIQEANKVNGAVTDKEGNFEISEIKPGSYFVEVSFIGYEKKRIKDINLNKSSPEALLGEIQINPSAVNVGNVVVEGQRVPFTYQVDKKVINVDQLPMASSGTAVDVLENVPSVSVDIDGNVSLRGSGSFTVLIDGRPTMMDPQDLLQQIPASSIENIEIITNPSVKYDPEGVAGIINLVLKKNKNLGLSGVANLNAGLKDKYGSDFLFEYKAPLFSSVFGLDYRKRTMTETGREEKRYDYQGSSSFINSISEGRMGRNGYGIRGNINFNLGETDILGFGGRYHNREMNRGSSADYSEISLQLPLGLSYINKNESKRTGNSYSLSMNYQHKFETKGHELTADLSYESEDGDDYSLSELIRNQTITEGKKTTEGGPGGEFNTKIDYTLPTGTDSKFESGIEGQTEFQEESTGYFEFSSNASDYFLMPQYSFSTKSRNDEYSVYSVFSSMIGNFGYQAGARGEYTYRKIRIPSKLSEFTVDRFDYFPTLHFSYKLNSGEQFIASYTKRIHRPHNWELEPFDTWVDANTVHRGNPSLQPELIDSYEFGFQTLLGLVSFSSELYYRVNNNKIESLRSVYADNVTLESFDNIGSDYSLGTELMASFDLFKFWNVDLTGNLYDYRLKTNFNGQSNTKKSFNWRSRMSNSLKVGSILQLQLNAEYRGPTVSLQGRTEDSFSLDLAVKKELLERQLTLTLQVRDMLSTARYQSVTEATGLYSFSKRNRESPMLMLNLKYSINNFKQQRDRDQGGDDFGEEGM